MHWSIQLLNKWKQLRCADKISRSSTAKALLSPPFKAKIANKPLSINTPFSHEVKSWMGSWCMENMARWDNGPSIELSWSFQKNWGGKWLYRTVLLNYFLQRPPRRENISCPLLTRNKIIIYKNCISTPVHWDVHGPFSTTSCPQQEYAQPFEKCWYRRYSRTMRRWWLRWQYSWLMRINFQSC